jgi:peptide/nickel transport system ATP-binding protein
MPRLEHDSDRPLLQIENLSVEIPLANGTLQAVRDVSFSLNKGEVLGIVGESGSGKSMSALALMGLLPPKAIRTAKVMRLGRHDLLAMDDTEIARKVVGSRVSMIFQEPMTSLNPVYTIGRQLTETMLLHRCTSKAEATERALYLLDKVGLPAAASRLGQYPHQLSGGQRQRVMIAMALMNEPELIIADEPTTALDVTIQAQVLRLLAELCREMSVAMILITHDLGVVSRTADKVAVVYAGQLVETGSVVQVLSNPQHPYTVGLLECMPKPNNNGATRLGVIPGMVPSLIGGVSGCAFANRCEHALVECHTTPPSLVETDGGGFYRCVLPKVLPGAHRHKENGSAEQTSLESPSDTDRTEQTSPVLSVIEASCVFSVRPSIFAPKQSLRAVDNVTLHLERGEILAVVGESGCGKTTLAKMMLGLQMPTTGTIHFEDKELFSTSVLERTRRIQPIFQDPHSSLNPRRTIGQSIGRPLKIHRIGLMRDHRREVERVMDLVGLPRRFYHAYPNQISGGQRQRVAIARAIIMKPDVLICDEPTSALDVSVQSQILNLLLDLRAELGLTYMIITHDLSVVEYMATRIAVMYLGQMVEIGDKASIFSNPGHPYTRILLESLLTMQPGIAVPDARMGTTFPNALDPPPGCRFHPRCPDASELCAQSSPSLGTEKVRCLLHGDQLTSGAQRPSSFASEVLR